MLINNIKEFFIRIHSHIINIEGQEKQIKLFAFLMAINFPMYWIVWYYSTSTHQENLSLRLFSFTLCILLLLRRYWPQKSETLFPYYWYFTVMMCLPFFFTYMTFVNHGATLWLMNSMSALFFTLLILDFISAMVILLLGTTLGYFCYFLMIDSPFTLNAGEVTLAGTVLTFFAAIIIGGFFARNSQIIQKLRLDTLKALAGSIAHELRTPLLAIESGTNSVSNFLPGLIDCYQKNKSKMDEAHQFNPHQLQALPQVLENTKKCVRAAHAVIDMTLMNIKYEKIQKNNFGIMSMKEVINRAVASYPFTGDDKNLIHWDDTQEDFSYRGKFEYTQHILYNLIKNALYYIHVAHKGQIYIYLKKGKNTNYLIFKDTSTGILSEYMPKLFKYFSTKREGGTGLGLAFCKLVMESYGGNITCDSEEGQYTQFTMNFPKCLSHHLPKA